MTQMMRAYIYNIYLLSSEVKWHEVAETKSNCTFKSSAKNEDS